MRELLRMILAKQITNEPTADGVIREADTLLILMQSGYVNIAEKHSTYYYTLYVCW